MNTKRFNRFIAFGALFALLFAPALVAQTLPGTDYSFPSFSPTLYIDTGNTATGAQTITLAFGQVATPFGISFNPVVGGASITVGGPTNAETVSISSASCTTPQIYETCQLTATFSNTHGRGEPVVFTGVSNPVKLQGSCSGTATASSTLGLFGLGQVAALTCTSTTVSLGQVMQQAGTIRALNVTATTGGVSSSSGVFTVDKNGSTTAVTCTLGTGTSCSDTAHLVTYAAGDVLSVQFTTQASETLAGVKAYVLGF